MNKFGIELEFFTSKNNVIIPAYEATNNLDGNPLLGEIKTKPMDSMLDCIFELKKNIFKEKESLSKNGFQMELIPMHQFDNKTLIGLRSDRNYIDSKETEFLEEFSIYPKGKISKVLKRGQVKASLQINLSNNNEFCIEGKKEYVKKVYSSLFNYQSAILKLDDEFSEDITRTKREKGVYAIKSGVFGNRIEYRSLPNDIDLEKLLKLKF